MISFQRATVGLFRSAKLQAVKIGGWSHHLGIEPEPHLRGSRWAGRLHFFQTSNFDSLQFWCQLTYRDPQYHFGKISTSLTNSSSIKRTKRILNTSYALSKWPHLHRAYVISGCIFFLLAVCKVWVKKSDTLSFRTISMHFLTRIEVFGYNNIKFLNFYYNRLSGP